MNKYLVEIKSAVLEHLNSIEEKEDENSALRKSYHNGDIAKNDYEKQAADLKNNNNKEIESIKAINKVVENYEADLKEWAILKAEELTDDLKLFNSPIKLNAEDYEALEEKYEYNYSMLKAIKDHAEKNEVFYAVFYSVDKEEKLKSFNDFVTGARNIIESTNFNGSKNYTGALWSHEDNFNKIYADTAKFIQTGK